MYRRAVGLVARRAGARPVQGRSFARILSEMNPEEQFYYKPKELKVGGDGRAGGDVNVYGHGAGHDWTAPKTAIIWGAAVFIWWCHLKFAKFSAQKCLGKPSPHPVLG